MDNIKNGHRLYQEFSLPQRKCWLLLVQWIMDTDRNCTSASKKHVLSAWQLGRRFLSCNDRAAVRLTNQRSVARVELPVALGSAWRPKQSVARCLSSEVVVLGCCHRQVLLTTWIKGVELGESFRQGYIGRHHCCLARVSVAFASTGLYGSSQNT